MYQETLPSAEGNSNPLFQKGDILMDRSQLLYRVDCYFSTKGEYVLSRICSSVEYDFRWAPYIFSDDEPECIECIIVGQYEVEEDFVLVASYSGSVHYN